MSTSHELIIDIADIKTLGVHCALCGTEVLLAMSTHRSAPDQCPSCRESFSTDFGKEIEAFMRLCSVLRDRKNGVSLRITHPAA